MSLEALVNNLRERQKYLRKDRNIYTYELKEVDPKMLIVYSFGHIIKGIERKSTIVDLSVTIGRRVRQKLKLNRNSIAACQIGWFILISFFENDLVSYNLEHVVKKGSRKSKYPTYRLKVKNKELLFKLWEEVTNTNLEIDLFPVIEIPADWKSGIHVTGVPIIKKSSSEFLKKFNSKEHQYIFDVLNKLNRTAWIVNVPVLKVYDYYFSAKTEETPFKFKTEKNKEKAESLLIEASSIFRLASKFSDKVFYHLYNYDFRGRIYSNTAFFHEQSSDNAKGLLLFAKGTPLGEEGFYWLLVHGANSWGEDKLSLDDRAEFCLSRFNEYCKIAEDPYTNTDWMKAEKPFQFLAFCYELALIKQWTDSGEELETFVSNLPIFIDGSCSGVQHLAAMSRDTEIAPYVNLVPTKLPGDLYSYVAKKVWKQLEKLEMQLPAAVYHQFEKVLEEATSLQKTYDEAKAGSQIKADAYEAAQTWRNNNRALRVALFPVYWNRIKDVKTRRKIVKRNTMTISYGSTPYGCGQQIIEDTKDLSEYLNKQEHLWAVLLGQLVHKTCREELGGPGKLLTLFENIAEIFNDKQKHLSWNSPITNFPVFQNYRQPKVHRTKLKHGEEELNVVVENWEEATLDKSSQKSGASPNIVHSLDATHMAIVIHDAPFDVAGVHDSFGCTAGNMSRLFSLTREKFVELYDKDPLRFILKQLDCEHMVPKYGKLDINLIKESDFAFS